MKNSDLKDMTPVPSRWAFSFLLPLLLLLMSVGCTQEEDEGDAPKEVIEDMGVDMIVDMRLPDMGTSIDTRCPDVQAGTFILVLYPDRVEAFKQDEVGFEVTHHCTFLALNEQGVTRASGIARGADDDFYVVQPVGDEGGAIYVYSSEGEFLRKIGPNINLKEVKGLWRIDDQLVAWSARSSNLYAFSLSGEYIGAYQPPEQASARLQNLTDLQYIDRDTNDQPRVIATFSDRPPQLFASPFSPSFAESEIASAKAMTTVETQIGAKILLSGEVDGNPGGVIQYRPVISGREPPIKEEVLVLHVDEGYGDGADIIPITEGFIILDAGTKEGGSPGINSFNTFGIPQVQNPLTLEGTPIHIMIELIFEDF